MITVYGIKECDTVKKCLTWLVAHQLPYRFHDLRRDGLDKDLLQRWIDALGWEALVNKRSTTWRELPEKTKADLSESTVVEVLLAHPTLIKRPVVDTGKTLLLGFHETDYASRWLARD
ncbi:MAG: ArsC family reductase [Pseudomonadota bacterium]